MGPIKSIEGLEFRDTDKVQMRGCRSAISRYGKCVEDKTAADILQTYRKVYHFNVANMSLARQLRVGVAIWPEQKCIAG